MSSRQVAKNTLFLYFRTIFVMGVSIYTSRVVLDVLGVEDYGIYNAVGGFVTMFTVLSGTLTAASQRFIAFELGKKDSDVKKVFSATLTIHLVLAGIILLLMETVGLWFLNSKMNISPDKLDAANWVFQCSAITFCINLICIPYNAAIIAYEKMSAFAYISIVEVSLKLCSVYLLYVIAFDSLICYSMFMLLIALLLRVIYSAYCTKHCPGCKFGISFDKQMFKSIFSFSGWNFIGSASAILNTQGINMLMNLFFGVTLNAARGVAVQLDNALNTFVNNFMMALSPQITKGYSAGNYEYVNKLIISGTKFSFFLFYFLCTPVYFCSDYILHLWLKQVPDYSSLFVRCAILCTITQTLSQCLYRAMLATGNIKKYQIVVGSLSLLAFPLTYICYKVGLPAEYGYITTIIMSAICLLVRIKMLKSMIPLFSPKLFSKDVLLRISYTVIPALALCVVFHMLYEVNSFMTFIVESLVILSVSSVFIWFIGFNKNEKRYILSFFFKKFATKE